jgi:endo-1,4-beta-D-glucanase Y
MPPRSSSLTGKRRHPVSILGLTLLLALCACGRDPSPARVEQVLQASWQSYVRHYVSPEGRVTIPERGGETISEAQAYALLRAVWSGDEATFARVYDWTRLHLSRTRTCGDSLLAWRWGPRPDGSWGVLDINTASDGDLDFALALTLAARRGWPSRPGAPDYAAESKRVAGDILNLEVVTLPTSEALLTPGNWHETEPPYLVNPSYFSPGAYRLWQQDTNGNPWRQLHRSTYQFLERLALKGLDQQSGPGLAPDWCLVDSQGRLRAGPPGRDSDFGWEAARLPWRLSLDALWFRESNAATILDRYFLPFLKKEWQAKGKLAAVYGIDGAPRVSYESPVMYAGALAAALGAGDRDFARVMARKILSFYQEKDAQAYFVSPDNYYANNWAWLGLALYAGWVKPFGPP